MPPLNRKILIVDDNESIHNDFRKVLLSDSKTKNPELENLESSLFGTPATISSLATPPATDKVVYDLDFASQGQDALEMVKKAEGEGQPYALLFTDVRMPPGWDGIETTQHIWAHSPLTEVVICTAYSDHSSDEIVTRLGVSDRLLFLKKPFDPVVVEQLALTLTTKWNLAKQNREHLSGLETLVQERTRELKKTVNALLEANEELSQSMKKQEETQAMLIQASKMSALGEMAGGIAHEINNPLATLKIVSEQIDSLLEDEPIEKLLVVERVKTIRQTVERVGKIISGMLAFTRTSQNTQAEPLLISEIISNTLVFCTEKLSKNGVRLEVASFSPELKVNCRGNQLSQVILNLLNNAADAIGNSAEKWIRIEITEGPESISLSITNGGPTISSEVKKKLFTRFFTTKPAGKGTGLGLNISQQIVREHGGRIEVDTASGHTCFRIHLPKLNIISSKAA